MMFELCSLSALPCQSAMPVTIRHMESLRISMRLHHMSVRVEPLPHVRRLGDATYDRLALMEGDSPLAHLAKLSATLPLLVAF
jgi:hypothetical protein